MGSGLTLIPSFAFCHEEDRLRGAILASCGSALTAIIYWGVDESDPWKK
jgi:hypothetical protein